MQSRGRGKTPGRCPKNQTLCWCVPCFFLTHTFLWGRGRCTPGTGKFCFRIHTRCTPDAHVCGHRQGTRGYILVSSEDWGFESVFACVCFTWNTRGRILDRCANAHRYTPGTRKQFWGYTRVTQIKKIGVHWTHKVRGIRMRRKTGKFRHFSTGRQKSSQCPGPPGTP